MAAIFPSITRLVPPWLWLIFGLSAITIYRWLALTNAHLDLYLDEAYYYGWSLDLDWGYYSKPPLIAWVIALATHSCGNSELCIRAPALLLHPLTALGLYLSGRWLWTEREGLLAATIYLTLPLVYAGSWVISTDTLLLAAWSYALAGLVRALEYNQWHQWLTMGLAIGIGLLAKYTMVAFPLSLLLYLLITPNKRHQLANPRLWIALGLALLVLSPNLLWNAHHGFISFHHTAEKAGVRQWGLHWDELGEFVGGQLLVFGPVLIPALVRSMGRETISQRVFLASLGFPLLLGMILQSLISQANANWAAPAYLSLTLLTAAWLANHPRWLAGALVINIAIGTLGYHYDGLAQSLGITLRRSQDPYARLRGWHELGQQIQTLLDQHPGAGLLGDDRATLAELVYYLRPHPRDAVVWNPQGNRSSQYHLKADIADHPRGERIFVARYGKLSELIGHFAAVVDLGSVRVVTHPDAAREYQIFLVRDFSGYGQPPQIPPS